MPGISIADRDALLRSLEQVPMESADAQRAAALLREYLEQTEANGSGVDPVNEQRPKSLRSSVLGRVPPFGEGQ